MLGLAPKPEPLAMRCSHGRPFGQPSPGCRLLRASLLSTSTIAAINSPGNNGASVLHRALCRPGARRPLQGLGELQSDGGHILTHPCQQHQERGCGARGSHGCREAGAIPVLAASTQSLCTRGFGARYPHRRRGGCSARAKKSPRCDEWQFHRAGLGAGGESMGLKLILISSGISCLRWCWRQRPGTWWHPARLEGLW